jgi:hypothetical protein
MNDTYKYFLRRYPLSFRDASFINVMCLASVGMLLQMGRSLICQCLTKARLLCQCLAKKRLACQWLTKARLVCQWLEGILKLIDKLDATNANKKGN